MAIALPWHKSPFARLAPERVYRAPNMQRPIVFQGTWMPEGPLVNMATRFASEVPIHCLSGAGRPPSFDASRFCSLAPNFHAGSPVSHSRSKGIALAAVGKGRGSDISSAVHEALAEVLEALAGRNKDAVSRILPRVFKRLAEEDRFIFLTRLYHHTIWNREWLEAVWVPADGHYVYGRWAQNTAAILYGLIEEMDADPML